ncbi:MAG TPA: hypothetical protein VF157_04675 [Chloroflexota bacterium]
MALPEGKGQDAAVAYDGDLQAVYVAQASGQLTIVDAARKAVARTVAIMPDVSSIGFDGQFVYLAGAAKPLQVIRKADWSMAGSAASPDPLAGSIWVDGQRDIIYAPTQQGDVLGFTGGASPSPASRGHLGAAGGPITGSGDTIYMASGSELSALSLPSGQVTAAATQLGPVTGLAFDGRTGLLWAPTADHLLLVVEGKTLQMQHTLSAKSSGGIVFDPGLRFIYTLGNGFGSYDTNTNKQWAQIDLESPTPGGAANPTNHELYVYESAPAVVDVYAWGVSGSGPAAGSGGGGTAPLGTANGGAGSSATSSSAATGSGAGAAAGGGGTSTTPSPPSANASGTTLGAPTSNPSVSTSSPTGGTSSSTSITSGGSAGSTTPGTTAPTTGTTSGSSGSGSSTGTSATSAVGGTAAGTSGH